MTQYWGSHVNVTAYLNCLPANPNTDQTQAVSKRNVETSNVTTTNPKTGMLEMKSISSTATFTLSVEVKQVKTRMRVNAITQQRVLIPGGSTSADVQEEGRGGESSTEYMWLCNIKRPELLLLEAKAVAEVALLDRADEVAQLEDKVEAMEQLRAQVIDSSTCTRAVVGSHSP
jgi:hypothetical protein